MAFFEILDDFLWSIIILPGVVALVAVLRAHGNLRKESDALQACKILADKLDEFSKQKKGTDSNGIDMQDGYAVIKEYIPIHTPNLAPAKAPENAQKCGIDSSAKAQELLNSIPTGKAHALRTSYVSDRLYAILCSVSEENMVRVAPSLEDLHCLTRQREDAGLCVSSFRALIPSILVMGICGTLIQVHILLPSLSDSKDASLQIIAPALGPGALAVFITIILLFFRGFFYNRVSRAFISELDDFTIKKLLPFFQPQDVLVADTTRSLNRIQKVITEELSLDETKVQLSEFRHCLQQWVNKSGEFFADLRIPVLVRLPRNMIRAHQTLSDRRRGAKENLQNLLKVANTCAATIQRSTVELSAMSRALHELVSFEGELAEHSTKVTQLVKEIHPRIETLAQSIRRCGVESGTAAELEQYTQEAVKLAKWCQELSVDFMLECPDNALKSLETQIENLDYYFAKSQDLPQILEERRSAADNQQQIEQWRSTIEDKATRRVSSLIVNLIDSFKQLNKTLQRDGRLYSWTPLGIKLFLQDSVKRARAFLYRTVVGRIVLGAGLLLYLIWVFLPLACRLIHEKELPRQKNQDAGESITSQTDTVSAASINPRANLPYPS